MRENKEKKEEILFEIDTNWLLLLIIIFFAAIYWAILNSAVKPTNEYKNEKKKQTISAKIKFWNLFSLRFWPNR